jgi:hypothetical protein
MKIAIAGAGWYGCHIASTLMAHDMDVTVLEKNAGLFTEASGNNQFRLHQGLHYARSASTRHQTRDGYHRFVERYPRLSRPVTDNLYLVPSNTSLIDFETYFSIMLSSGISVERVGLEPWPFIDRTKFEGAIRCQERVILTSRAREHFEQRLKDVVRFGHVTRLVQQTDDGVRVDGEHFDLFIDATWGALSPVAHFFYEPTLLLYYQLRQGEPFPAITLVDGPLWSIYPTETHGVFTVSSVTHTPLGCFENKADAYRALKSIGVREIHDRRLCMEAEVRRYLPAFNEMFKFVGPQMSIKTKPMGMSDSRACGVERDRDIFSVISGKVDNIFFATDRILGSVVAA